MEVLRVNSEELERLQTDILLNKLVYNHCKPGTGKSRKIHQIIDYCIVLCQELPHIYLRASIFSQ